MKYLTGIASIIVLGFAVQSFLPWWSIVLVAVIIGAAFKFSSLQSYLIGFLGVSLLWGIYATFLNNANDGILAEKIGVLFGDLGVTQLIIVTALLGGIIGGLGALTGKLGRGLLKP